MSGRAALAIAAAARTLAGATVRTTGFVPDVRQRVYYANHTSHLDSIVLWSALPKAVRALTRPVAARDYWDVTRLRRYLARDVFHAILIERHPTGRSDHPIEHIVAEMGNRYSIIVFPEGTRGEGDEIAPFKSGIHRLVQMRPDLELVPVFIENLNRVLPKGVLVPVPLLSSITFGCPIPTREGEARVEFLDRARGELRRLAERRHGA
ncbi:MAG: 1-acyl-sn-glycerol-3-phosphate acyltransferase [Planctomycetes bacterium]|nr:1-acyl-sn-glycerol-3-phosphate acyltransferase [Planctomycetota bacterium]MBI3843924.1 1-acyl-sn-glycerol-3-phosphate acyltransferase [Planctomycetota bacterium]